MIENKKTVTAMSAGQNWIPDSSFLDRIKRSYRIASKRYRQPDGSMWAVIADRRKPIHDALMADDDALTADLLASPAKTELYYGMDTLVLHMVDALKSAEGARIHVQQSITDHFMNMAAITGAARMWNSETSQPKPELTEALLSDIISRLDALAGSTIDFPNAFPDEFGIVTSRGLMTHRAPMAIYQSYRMQTVADIVGGQKVLEIGPGNGRCAFHSRQFGFSDYTTVDLPIGIVGQAVFLGALLGPDKIWMIGDDIKLQSGRIRLMPPFALDELNETFDIVLNVDSFTEMATEQSVQYLKFAAANSKALLSINHESNANTVQDLVRMSGNNHRAQRSILSIRHGYVEELYIWPKQQAQTMTAGSDCGFRVRSSALKQL